MARSTAHERQSLEAHVDLCALRYEGLEKKMNDIDAQFEKIDQRFDAISDKISKIETDIKKNNNQVIVALIGATTTIITAFVGIIIAVV